MYDCDETNTVSRDILLYAIYSKGNWWVVISAIATLLFIVNCGGTKYQGSTVCKESLYGMAGPQVTSDILKDLGYTIDKVNKDLVTTKWASFMSNRGTDMEEFHSVRFVVLLKKKLVLGQCHTTKEMYDGPCVHPILLRRVNRETRNIANVLPITEF